MFDRLSDPKFPELDGFAESQRRAVLEELELRSPAHTRSLWLLFGLIPFTVLMAVGNGLIMRYNLMSLLAFPLVLISAAVSVLPIWYAVLWHVHRVLAQLLKSRSCKGCGYSMLGMQATQVWVSCPECGEIYKPEPHELTAQGVIATPAMIGRMA